MSTYQWLKAGYGLPGLMGNRTTLVKKIDVPTLIANGARDLALVAAPNTPVALASTGFAANDILEVFWVPAGTMVEGAGMYVITGEGDTATIHIGVTASTETEDGTDIDGWGASMDIETAGVTDGTADDDGYGSDNVPGGELYITDGSIDIEFNNATDTAVFVVWVDVRWIPIT